MHKYPVIIVNGKNIMEDLVKKEQESTTIKGNVAPISHPNQEKQSEILIYQALVAGLIIYILAEK